MKLKGLATQKPQFMCIVDKYTFDDVKERGEVSLNLLKPSGHNTSNRKPKLGDSIAMMSFTEAITSIEGVPFYPFAFLEILSIHNGKAHVYFHIGG